jgi:hypothetical protein
MYLDEQDFDDIFRGNNLYSVGGEGDFPGGNYMSKKYRKIINRVGFYHSNMLHKSFWSWFLITYPDAEIIYRGTHQENKKLFTSSYVIEVESLKLVFYLYPDAPKKPLGESHFNCSFLYVDYNLFSVLYEQMKEAGLFYTKPPGREDKISLIVQRGQGSLDTEEYPIKIGNMDIALNYGEDFMPAYNKIVKRLNTKNDKGIVLLHGIPGTGKTSLIKYLVKKVKKEVIFIPPSMAESITSPSFIPFLMDHPNSILVLEDAERVLQDRNNTGGNQGVSNILNVSDGILGDCLNIQIIATFNTNLNSIDHALLRKGRLIVEHEFKALSVEQANKLLESLGREQRVNKSTTLTDIYNMEEEEFKTIKGRQAVGFNAK